MVVIYREQNCAENYAKFCLENGQICETAQCQYIDSTQFHAGYGVLSAEWFAILKSFFTNNETFLLNKSRPAKGCRMLLMHWYVHFFLIGHLLGARELSTVFSVERTSAVYGSGMIVEPIHG